MSDHFTPDMLTKLRSAYAGIDRVAPHHLPRFHAIIDGCPNEAALRQLVEGNIKFVSKLARNAAVRRGLIRDGKWQA